MVTLPSLNYMIVDITNMCTRKVLDLDMVMFYDNYGIVILP